MHFIKQYPIMKTISRMLVAASLLVSFGAGAQSFQTGYFLDNFVYNYRLNPALHDEELRSLFSLGIGDISVTAGTNTGLPSILFPCNGKLVFGTSRNIPSSLFPEGLPSLTKLSSNIDLSIITFGYRTENGFISFDARLRSMNRIEASKDLFRSLKADIATAPGSVYDIDRVLACTSNLLEMGAAYSFRAGNFRLGLGAKALLGVGYADVTADNLRMEVLSDGRVKVNSTSSVMTSCSVFDFNPKDLNDISLKRPGLSGIGFSLEAGFLWNTPVEGFSVSAGVINFGGISWKRSLSGKTDGNQFVLNETEIGKIYADVLKLDSGQGSEFVKLDPTYDVGLKYKLPFIECVTAGLHGSFTTGRLHWTDIRFGLTLTPANAISLAATVGKNNFGGAVGVAVNFRFGPINIFGGVDGLVTKFTDEGLPQNAMNTAAKLGITIAVK